MRKSTSRTALEILPVVEPVGRLPFRRSPSQYFLGQQQQQQKKWATYADTIIVLVCVLAVSVLVWLYAVHKLYLGHMHEAPVYSPRSLHQSDLLRQEVDVHTFNHMQD